MVGFPYDRRKLMTGHLFSPSRYWNVFDKPYRPIHTIPIDTGLFTARRLYECMYCISVTFIDLTWTSFQPAYLVASTYNGDYCPNINGSRYLEVWLLCVNFNDSSLPKITDIRNSIGQSEIDVQYYSPTCGQVAQSSTGRALGSSSSGSRSSSFAPTQPPWKPSSSSSSVPSNSPSSAPPLPSTNTPKPGVSSSTGGVASDDSSSSMTHAEIALIVVVIVAAISMAVAGVLCWRLIKSRRAGAAGISMAEPMIRTADRTELMEPSVSAQQYSQLPAEYATPNSIIVEQRPASYIYHQQYPRVQSNEMNLNHSIVS